MPFPCFTLDEFDTAVRPENRTQPANNRDNCWIRPDVGALLHAGIQFSVPAAGTGDTRPAVPVEAQKEYTFKGTQLAYRPVPRRCTCHRSEADWRPLFGGTWRPRT